MVNLNLSQAWIVGQSRRSNEFFYYSTSFGRLYISLVLGIQTLEYVCRAGRKMNEDCCTFGQEVQRAHKYTNQNFVSKMSLRWTFRFFSEYQLWFGFGCNKIPISVMPALEGIESIMISVASKNININTNERNPIIPNFLKLYGAFVSPVLFILLEYVYHSDWKNMMNMMNMMKKSNILLLKYLCKGSFRTFELTSWTSCVYIMTYCALPKTWDTKNDV